MATESDIEDTVFVDSEKGGLPVRGGHVACANDDF